MHAPAERFPKQKLSVRKKPGLTLDLQISASIKNNLLTKYIRLEDLTAKNQAKYKK